MFILSLLLGSCSLPKQPCVPEWTVTMKRLPLLAADTLALADAIPDSSFIIDDNDLYHIFFSGENEISFRSQLHLGSIIPDPVNGEIGSFKIMNTAGRHVHFNIYDVFPGLERYNNTTTPVPEIKCNTSQNIVFDNYLTVTFESGAIHVRIVNNLAFPLGKPVYITLYDHTFGVTISELLFDQYIPANGGEGEATFDLAGKTISNDMRVSIAGTVAGTGAQSVYLAENQGFDVYVEMEDLIAVAAEAKIPSQSYSTMQYLDLSTDSMVIEKAHVTSGSINLSIGSNFYLPIELDITFPGVVDGRSQPMHKVFTILSESTQDILFDLTNTTITMTEGLLAMDITTTLLPRQDDYIRIRAGDRFAASAMVSDLQFSEITAALDLVKTFPAVEKEIVKAGMELPQILLQQAVLTMDFYNNPAAMTVNLDFEGKNSGRQFAGSHYTFAIPHGAHNRLTISGNDVLVNGVPGGSGSGLLDLVNLMPNRIVFSGMADIHDDHVTLSETPVDIHYSVDVPMIFGLPDHTIMQSDTIAFDFNNSHREQIERLQDVKLEFSIVNGLPLGGLLQVRVADSTMLANRAVEEWPVLSSLTFRPAEVDNNGNVTLIKEERLQSGLNSDQLELLLASEAYFWSVEFDSLTIARLKCSDQFILQRAYLSGTVTVNEDTFKGENDSE